MAVIDKDAFDGSIIQKELLADCGQAPTHTQISLIARASDGFTVMNGSDAGRESFDDTEIAQIFVVFAEAVKAFSDADASTLRTAVAAALAGMWTPCSAVLPCPFDQHVHGLTRMIFNIHVPGWGFEDARIKFKGVDPTGQFCGLDWLTLNGENCKPYSFQIQTQPVEAPADYEFALFINASQDAGNQATRVIIDPIARLTPP
ncbi:hypothetical protein [Maricaulis sp.]|uniref:hypothetical protein n=1 Tax=Maricaulis sp. TaxID=1486257 RepID=UPI000C5E9338|nr:hypothetical protein [Maricaulis sp.]MAC90081.1 hypothetical protein [Maricaulis sp.]